MTDPRVALVRSTLRTLHPRDQREAASRQRILDELGRLRRPFDEQADPVHVTGSAIVTSTRGVLLHRHRRLGMWLQPGGHLDPGETPWDAAVREVAEETGLQAAHPAQGPTLWHVDVHPGGRGHTHLDLRYLLAAAPDEPCPPPGESQEVAWFPLAETVALADPGLVGAVRGLGPGAPHRR